MSNKTCAASSVFTILFPRCTSPSCVSAIMSRDEHRDLHCDWHSQPDFKASELSDEELREEAVSIADLAVDGCTIRMIQAATLSADLATQFRDWLVRAQVISYQLRRDPNLGRDDVWGMLVELRHLMIAHFPIYEEQVVALLRREKGGT